MDPDTNQDQDTSQQHLRIRTALIRIRNTASVSIKYSVLCEYYIQYLATSVWEVYNVNFLFMSLKIRLVLEHKQNYKNKVKNTIRGSSVKWLQAQLKYGPKKFFKTKNGNVVRFDLAKKLDQNPKSFSP